MTTPSNSWVKFKGDKNVRFLAEFFMCRCAVCWPSYCPLTHEESQVDFKKIHSLLGSFCSPSWRQHKWVSCEWTGGVCSCKSSSCHGLEEFHPRSLHASFPPEISFSPFLNIIYVFLLLTSKPCSRSFFWASFREGKEWNLLIVWQYKTSFSGFGFPKSPSFTSPI